MDSKNLPSEDIAPRMLYRLLLAVIIGCPLLWGINQSLSILYIQLLSLPLIWFTFAGRHELLDGYFGLLVFSGLLLAAIVWQLIPVPISLWETLPGRQAYSDVMRLLPEGLTSQWRGLSVVPQDTEKALLFVIPAIAVFLATLLLDKQSLTRIMLVIIGLACFQSVLGLLQYGGGIQLVDNVLYTGSARGTYLNRDHLASFLVMVFPVVLALLASMLGYRQHHRYSKGSLRRQWRFIATLQGNQALLYAVIAILVILCLVFTRSRAGIALLMIGLFLSLFAFSTRLGKSNIYGAYGTVIAIITVLALEIGLTPVLDRFSVDPMQDLRWEIYAISLRIIGEFFPLGSGAGTFSSVYAAYQTPDLDAFINHAHNDYLQWTLEGGLPVLLLMLFFLYRYATHWRYVWIPAQWGDFRFIQVGAGIGVLLVTLHSLLDFPLHKPANALVFAFFLAVFFQMNHQGRVTSHANSSAQA